MCFGIAEPTCPQRLGSSWPSDVLHSFRPRRVVLSQLVERIYYQTCREVHAERDGHYQTRFMSGPVKYIKSLAGHRPCSTNPRI